MAFVEQAPKKSRLFQALEHTMDRMKPRNPHKISFQVLDRIGFPVIGSGYDDLPQTAALKPAERAEIDDLQRLRGAIYADGSR